MKFEQIIVLTTPESEFYENFHDGYKANNDDDHDTGHNYDENSQLRQSTQSPIVLSDIKGNSTDEKNSSIYYNNAEVEHSNYDMKANEIQNSTFVPSSNNNGTTKKAKYLQDAGDAEVNLTILIIVICDL